MKKLTGWIFYSNFFIGACAIALCFETSFLNRLALNSPAFYLFIFTGTFVYYAMIYVRCINTVTFDNRTLWYRENLGSVKTLLYFFTASAFLLAGILFINNVTSFLRLSFIQLVFILSFPIVATWYTFSPVVFDLKKIRQTGWLKPFIVGYTWAGWVTVLPLLFLKKTGAILLPSIYVFALNFLFFSINAIFFDIKDHVIDSLHQLKTIPVLFGIRNTFRFVIAPLMLVSFSLLFFFQRQQQFTFLQSLIQVVPYLLLIIVLLTYRSQRSVLYYLVAVDGLLFIKAVCGISSILFFK